MFKCLITLLPQFFEIFFINENFVVLLRLIKKIYTSYELTSGDMLPIVDLKSLKSNMVKPSLKQHGNLTSETNWEFFVCAFTQRTPAHDIIMSHHHTWQDSSIMATALHHHHQVLRRLQRVRTEETKKTYCFGVPVAASSGPSRLQSAGLSGARPYSPIVPVFPSNW